MRHLNAQVAYSDQAIERLAAHDARVQRLRTVPSIGPVTATAFVATIDDVRRFRRAHEVEAYLGLVPRELSPGETQRRGPITKAGHPREPRAPTREGSAHWGDAGATSVAFRAGRHGDAGAGRGLLRRAAERDRDLARDGHVGGTVTGPDLHHRERPGLGERDEGAEGRRVRARRGWRARRTGALRPLEPGR